VFRDGDARARGDDGARRRDVDRIVSIAASAAGIDQWPVVGVDPPRGVAHPGRKAGYLRLRLALRPQCGEQRPDLGLRCLLEHQ